MDATERRRYRYRRDWTIGFAMNIGLSVWLAIELNHPTGFFAKATSAVIETIQLPAFVQKIEEYKTKNGHYPRELAELGETYINDTMKSQAGSTLGNYFYKLSDDGAYYELFVTGPDKTPFTADDILPLIGPSEAQKTGLKIR